MRPGQIDLAGEVAALLDAGGLGLFEAGTGMGKSLAYLLPAAFRAAACGARVTVSTKTKALQRQLAERELPLVAIVPARRFSLDAAHGPRELPLPATARRGGRRRRATACPTATACWRWPGCRAARGRGEVDVSALPYGATQALPALAETARELRASAAACLGGRCRVARRLPLAPGPQRGARGPPRLR